jgi:hypothetical protein
MSKIDRLDVSRFVLDIHRDLSVSARGPNSGPFERIDGMTVGIPIIRQEALHDGEQMPKESE